MAAFALQKDASHHLRRAIHNDIVVFMLPALTSHSINGVLTLPPGLHFVSLREFRDAFSASPKRAWLFQGFVSACRALRESGCGRIYVGGSYVTSKANPGDYDACWDPTGVSGDLDPILYDDNLLLERRQQYRGDLLIGRVDEGPAGENFRFLSRDKTTGEERGMIGIKLSLLEILNL